MMLGVFLVGGIEILDFGACFKHKSKYMSCFACFFLCPSLPLLWCSGIVNKGKLEGRKGFCPHACYLVTS